jgi:putative ABC transport system ATP-binding protein
MKPLIQLHQVHKRFGKNDSAVTALKGIDLEIDQGEFVALTGPSGAGKSTLMHLLGCLDSPSDGIYELDGKNVAYLSRHELSSIRNIYMGFVFQQFYLLPDLNVKENVILPMIYGNLDQKTASARAEFLLGELGLANRLKHRPEELSGGQKQRVAIARALSMHPKILFADEPTGSLDSESSAQIMKLFEKINQEEGVTIVLVTHDLKLAKQAKRNITICDGKITKDSRG